ncbi:MAG: alcohol dehydrogenase catalytic domain-containing protein [Phycisphaerae bacterium]
MGIPKKQRAVQLTGPNQLKFNTEKEVYLPNDYQILCKVEAVGLCFSDLKLLKQFDSHVRKGKIVSGAEQAVLNEYPAYKTEKTPTVPGHEAVVRAVKVGSRVTRAKVGDRFLVQADMRWLKTEKSNGAFGYNIEGALQEYTLIDERISCSPEGEFILIPAPEDKSASAVALCEPWACVEDSYISKERKQISPQSKMLVVTEDEFNSANFTKMLEKFGKPEKISDAKAESLENINEKFDDIVYFGAKAETIEKLFDKAKAHALINIVLCGKKIDREVETAVGLVHYGGIRIIGTTGDNPADAMKHIPPTGEIRTNDKVNVIGAGGPMGVMHAIRNICQGIKGITVYAGDLDDNRLLSLTKIAANLAKEKGVKYIPYNPTKEKAPVNIDYAALMAPVPALAAQCVKDAAKGGIINIFAGIPAMVKGKIDLNAYIEKKLYFIGTSGSTIEDIKKVLAKVEAGKLDTNLSVAAVASLESAIEGIRAVENQSIAGKIIIYPQCGNLLLTTLEQMQKEMPDVASKLDNGLWTKEAENTLIEKFTRKQI